MKPIWGKDSANEGNKPSLLGLFAECSLFSAKIQQNTENEYRMMKKTMRMSGLNNSQRIIQKINP